MTEEQCKNIITPALSAKAVDTDSSNFWLVWDLLSRLETAEDDILENFRNSAFLISR